PARVIRHCSVSDRRAVHARPRPGSFAGPRRQGQCHAARRRRESPGRDLLRQLSPARQHRQFRRLHRDGWQQLIATMIVLPKDQDNGILDYLAKNFPELPRPKPVLLAGGAKVEFKEWNLPTLGSRPHDPLATPDGAIWYTGMFANVLGRVDPRSGAVKEYPVKTPQSGPHGLTADKDGKILFTANSKGYIGRLDSTTGAIH